MTHLAGKLSYPIGSQSFSEIRSKGYVYVDKTQYIPLLMTSGKYKFLSRPRRFGKSLLISMLESYFLGSKELFKGLAIDNLEPGAWESYPVVHIDLSGENYNSPDTITKKLDSILSDYEEKCMLEDADVTLSERFARIVKSLHQSSGRQVVVLIDEYDNPITSVIGDTLLEEEIKNILYGFYSVLKNLDDHLHFCMLTGVTKYGKLSIFSGLNNLNDISFDDEFAGICGITGVELKEYLEEGVKTLAETEKISLEKAYEILKENYDGYHFSGCMLDVYNPFSMMSALAKRRIGGYWFGSGTPGILLKFLRNKDVNISKAINVYVSPNEIDNISSVIVDPSILFYHTGYLTIKSYNPQYDAYLLGFPNLEVEKGFTENLLQVYTDAPRTTSLIFELTKCLEEGQIKQFINNLKSFLADIPYDLRKNVSKYENYYHTIFYTLFSLIGLNVKAEYHTSAGSIDILIQTKKYIYIIELKVNGTAKEAIAQIRQSDYSVPFRTDHRQLQLIGIGFSKATGTIDSYEIE